MGIVPAGWSRCAADKHFDANVTQWRDNGPTAPRQTNGIDLLHLFGGNGSGPMDSERDKLVLTGNVDTETQHDLALRIAQSYAGDRRIVDKIKVKQQT